jgi:hypothetical protein
LKSSLSWSWFNNIFLLPTADTTNKIDCSLSWSNNSLSRYGPRTTYSFTWCTSWIFICT